MAEPALDLSEIVDLYKEDARRMVKQMRDSLAHWDDVVAGGVARKDLRRLSHQLRGSGRTYGFRNVSRIGKALERIIQSLEKNALQADDRTRASVQKKINQLAGVFEV